MGDIGQRVEREVFKLLDEKKIDELSTGFYMRSDLNWKGLHYIKRPDLVHIDCIDNVVIARPFDIKSSLFNFKPPQISPLTLKGLYDNEDFREYFKTNLRNKGLQGKDFVFREGKFIAVHLSRYSHHQDEDIYYCRRNLSRSVVKDKLAKVNRIKQIVGYYPCNVQLYRKGIVRDVYKLSDFGNLGTKNYTIDPNTVLGVIYLDLGGSKIERIATARAIMLEDILSEVDKAKIELYQK